MTLKLVINKDGKELGLFISKLPNEIVYISKDEATFTYVPINVFNKRNYKYLEFDYINTEYWVNIINKKKIIYKKLNYHFCYQNLEKILVNFIDKFKLTIKNNYECPICLTDFPKGTKMISFHKENNKHLTCFDCFTKYNKDTCPLCRLNISF